MASEFFAKPALPENQGHATIPPASNPSSGSFEWISPVVTGSKDGHIRRRHGSDARQAEVSTATSGGFRI